MDCITISLSFRFTVLSTIPFRCVNLNLFDLLYFRCVKFQEIILNFGGGIDSLEDLRGRRRQASRVSPGAPKEKLERSQLETAGRCYFERCVAEAQARGASPGDGHGVNRLRWRAQLRRLLAYFAPLCWVTSR